MKGRKSKEMIDLELWLERNYPDIYAEWLESGDEDIEGWLEESDYYYILAEFDDWLYDEEGTSDYDDE